jgi:DnaJ-class molecular chaperone
MSRLLCGVIAVSLLMSAGAATRADTVVLKNGKTIEGEVAPADGDTVVVKTPAGNITFKKEDIKEIQRAADRKKADTGRGEMTREERAKALGMDVADLHEAGEQRVPCPKCNGSGIIIWLPCLRCKGSEKPGMIFLKYAKRCETCDRCDGKTKLIGAMCAVCNQRGKVYLSQLTPSQGGTKKPPVNFAWCPNCNGTGTDVWEDCNQCKRSKWKGFTYHGEYLDKCNRCDGVGKLAAHKCANCSGKGLVPIGGDAAKQFVQPQTGDVKPK